MFHAHQAMVASNARATMAAARKPTMMPVSAAAGGARGPIDVGDVVVDAVVDVVVVAVVDDDDDDDDEDVGVVALLQIEGAQPV